jgi:hypothetical protein
MGTKKYIKNRVKSRRRRNKKGTRQKRQYGGSNPQMPTGKGSDYQVPPPPKPEDM